MNAQLNIIGVVFQASPESSWQSLSGVLYGYDDANVRVWVPYKYAGDSDGLGKQICIALTSTLHLDL